MTGDFRLRVVEVEMSPAVSLLSIAVCVSAGHPSSRCLLILAKTTLLEQTGHGILSDDMEKFLESCTILDQQIQSFDVSAW